MYINEPNERIGDSIRFLEQQRAEHLGMVREIEKALLVLKDKPAKLPPPPEPRIKPRHPEVIGMHLRDAVAYLLSIARPGGVTLREILDELRASQYRTPDDRAPTHASLYIRMQQLIGARLAYISERGSRVAPQSGHKFSPTLRASQNLSPQEMARLESWSEYD